MAVGCKSSRFLLLGAVVLGLPAVALTGGHYLNSVLPFSVHFYASSMIILATLLNVISIDKVSKVLGVIGSSVIVILLILLIISFIGLNVDPNEGYSFIEQNSFDIDIIFLPFMMIFFAFTGWEVGSHSAEEFRNPERDFPLAMIFSFGIASVFYLAIAWVVQNSHMQTGFKSPFIELIYPVLGSNGSVIVAFVATLLVFANLFGAIWAISRLVYSLGRDTILPSVLADIKNGIPRRALVVVMTALLIGVLLDLSTVANLDSLMALSGQNFLILYGIAGASLFVLTQKLWVKCIAGSVLVIVIAVLQVAGVSFVYPLGLVIVASIFHFRQLKLRVRL
nr:amino acid permease [Psychrobacter sp. PraFG1]UTT87647.1 amino acid permease [Psychrobacter sp. PraFG1]